MTTHEAANRLGLTARSVARLIDQGLITAVKHGRDYWIDEAEVARYLSERKPAGRPKKG
jgi:excisionase family DNA binding protein